MSLRRSGDKRALSTHDFEKFEIDSEENLYWNGRPLAYRNWKAVELGGVAAVVTAVVLLLSNLPDIISFLF